mmetsp:Transcript_46833/g.125544  ORF Transcript_46833/g.125544 Transcript_46833/m.125544 type:complete len:298 (-) Transcript_46833:112-1005(-)
MAGAQGPDAEPDAPTVLSNLELQALVVRMRGQQLGTDQRELAAQALQGRMLTCRQAGAMLGVVQLGIMQRMLAFEVLRGRLSDLPDGLPDLLQPLSGRILVDVGNELGGDSFDKALYSDRLASARGTPSTFTGDGTDLVSAVAPSALLAASPREVARSELDIHPALQKKQSDWVESVDRLRTHVCNGDVSDSLYEDVRSVFDALGLGQLPPRQATPRAGAGAGAPAAPSPGKPLALPIKQLTKLPGTATVAAAQALPPLASSPIRPLESPVHLEDSRTSGEVADPGTPRSIGSEESV